MTALARFVERATFLFAIIVFAFGYGYLVQRFNWFPSDWLRRAETGWLELREQLGLDRPWYYLETTHTGGTHLYQPEKVTPGLTLMSMITEDRGQVARVIDAQGNVINEWDIDWFRVWPDADHLPEAAMPRKAPGVIVHGMLMMEDGGIIYNYDALGLVRLDACGNTLWRMPTGTHHSLERDEAGDIWTSVRYPRQPGDAGLSGYRHPYDEYTIARISPDGEIREEVSIFDLLRDNGLESLLYLSSAGDQILEIGGDTLHVNDVDVFPASMHPEVFQPGDIMVSMRAINTVIVFGWEDRSVRYVSYGPFIRQHDADFIDGNTISVFDNHNIGRPEQGVYSRIVTTSARDDSTDIPFTGSATLPFFTSIMGKHQYLENGNLLLVESTAGRVLEVDPQGKPVWEYVNLVDDGIVGLMAEGTRLPANFTPEFFSERRGTCST